MAQSDARPRYVARGGEQVYPQPYTARRVGYYGFVVAADAAAIQTHVCEALFNAPSGGAVRMRAVGDWALVTFDELAHLASADPPAREHGWFTEREAAIWILVEETHTGQFYWTIPYIFVDNGLALASGREVYGFPKAQGWIQMPASPDYPDFFGAETIVVPAYTANTQGVRRPALSAHRTATNTDTDARSDGAGGWHSDLRGLLGAAGEVVRQSGLAGGLDWQTCQNVWAFLGDLIQRQAPLVFLKQFRAADAPERACFQAVVASSAKLTGFHGGRLLAGRYTVEIADPPSHPMRRDLGISTKRVQAGLAFYADIDFRLETGRHLWRAGDGA